jgi:hypothetical protein
VSTRIEELLERTEARSRDRLRQNVHALAELRPARRHPYLVAGGALLAALVAGKLGGLVLRTGVGRGLGLLALLARQGFSGRMR